MKTVLIANRGEIAIRIAEAAAGLGLTSVAVRSADDAASLHGVRADRVVELPGRGPAAYLNIRAIISAAQEAGADAVHPGYGFLSENAGFARACAEAGLTFVGPAAETLDLLGDKSRARDLAVSLGVPVMDGTNAATTLEQARHFVADLPAGTPVLIKALAGGGGRGIRLVTDPAQLPSAYADCRSEAERAFGSGEVYVERFMPDARHVEVQVIGDGTGAAVHLWERECSLQRRNQKLVEIAPAPGLTEGLRKGLHDAALRLAQATAYRSAGTIEFLVGSGGDADFAFMEANARLQVEHTVTEEITGVDIVQTQLRIATGATLADLGLTVAPARAGGAMQLRVNMERIGPDGGAKPTGGTITAYDPPQGPGVRVDGYGYPGYRTNPSFDSLLAKVIVQASDAGFGLLRDRGLRALRQFRIEGVETNIPFLEGLLQLDGLGGVDGADGTGLHTKLVEQRLGDILSMPALPRLYVQADVPGAVPVRRRSEDPLSVLDYASAPDMTRRDSGRLDPDMLAAPMQGTVVEVLTPEDTLVAEGQRVILLEAMKMHHAVLAPHPGQVAEVLVEPGDTVFEGQPLMRIAAGEGAGAAVETAAEVDLDAIRPDLQELFDRRALLTDAARPDAVARRRKTGQRTVRENIAQLCDPGTLREYGSLVTAARRSRHSLDELRRISPADGLVTGVAAINGAQFDRHRADCAVIAYDYTVFAGTQGKRNHDKTDRMIEVAKAQRLPVVLFSEGGGGRPGDTDVQGVAGFHVMAFALYAQLSGLVPTVGIVSGRCFAGNASLLGCSDVVIATRNSNIGMAGPAMIEGGGLGAYRPEDIGPIEVHRQNGVVDIAVEDEVEAIEVAKKYVAFFQGPLEDWQAEDQRRLRFAIPENRREGYDIRALIDTLADTGSVLELRRDFGRGMVTVLARIEGRTVGIMANDPMHLGGAIDAPAADKGARFLQLCDAFDVPVLFLCDTPGMMVGPDAEATAQVRRVNRLFVTGANLSVPVFTVVLRKAVGLGALGMAGATSRAAVFSVAWPTAEFSGMGIEGAVKLGFRKELEAIADPEERRTWFEARVAEGYDRGKAVNAADFFEFDEVIDPAETRGWVAGFLHRAPLPFRKGEKKRPNIDTW
jgi:acetyl/propionyl-CoA carboxylase alpha subunit/acetyl-CoA carboxylase carboxyltransferase component